MRVEVTRLLDAIASMDVSALAEERRSAMAERWIGSALLEHASIASFARFSLHLLAVGAPPELLERTQRAALDEIEHARLAFAIAGRLRGEPVGPGPIPMAGDVLGRMDLVSVEIAATEEGCIGEALAALDADREAATEPTRPIADALASIARDEATHAELAFAFVRWAASTGGARVVEAVEATRLARLSATIPGSRELDASWSDLLAGTRSVTSLLGASS